MVFGEFVAIVPILAANPFGMAIAENHMAPIRSMAPVRVGKILKIVLGVYRLHRINNQKSVARAGDVIFERSEIVFVREGAQSLFGEDWRIVPGAEDFVARTVGRIAARSGLEIGGGRGRAWASRQHC